jgi:hypothetical protein
MASVLNAFAPGRARIAEERAIIELKVIES